MHDIAIERQAIAVFERLLDVPEPERDAWLAREIQGQPELLSRVRAMREADRRTALRTGAAIDGLDDEPDPERIGAYRVTGRIGRGGMGSVYRGERMTGDFAHVVAIKVIKPGLLSETLVDRFRRERQLLASLSHPHIARLYDGGETEGGSPYIVMEYVDGLPLLAWAEASEPSRTERVRLFAEICDAVAFAHRNLIVHRDLTPSNVLVTRERTAKLIDFGIARPPHSDDSAHEGASIGSLSLTPGYAAPERIVSGEVTTAADVYSLGKLLQKLIVAPEDSELRAIVAKATADEPQDRYASADALAADVRAWHEGMPVAAVSGGRRYVARKFVSRHRALVAAGAVALVLLIGALGATLVANARAERALVQSDRRFQETRAIAKALLFDAYDEVSKVPGSTQARERLARTGIAYLDALAADTAAPLDVRIEAGRGYLRLAEVVGGGLSSQLGRYEDANALLARSEQILAPIVRDHPENAAGRRAMAALLIEQSAVNLYNNNEVDLAREQAQQARALLQAEPRADLETARLTADAMRGEGDSFLWAEDYARARQTHLEAEAFIAGLPPALQRDPKIQSVRAGNLRLLAEAYHERGETANARAALDRAVAMARTVLASQPDDPQLRRRLATTLRYRAIVHRTNRRDELARQSIEQALVEARHLRDRDPSDIGSLQLFAVVSEVYMQTLSDLGRHADAYRIAAEIREAYAIMVERAGNAPGQLRSMAMALRSEAEVHYNGGDFAGACRAWSDVARILDGLERRRALTDFDRDNAQAETRDYLRRSCDPPRAGLGATI